MRGCEAWCEAARLDARLRGLMRGCEAWRGAVELDAMTEEDARWGMKLRNDGRAWAHKRKALRRNACATWRISDVKLFECLFGRFKSRRSRSPEPSVLVCVTPSGCDRWWSCGRWRCARFLGPRPILPWNSICKYFQRQDHAFPSLIPSISMIYQQMLQVNSGTMTTSRKTKPSTLSIARLQWFINDSRGLVNDYRN